MLATDALAPPVTCLRDFRFLPAMVCGLAPPVFRLVVLRLPPVFRLVVLRLPPVFRLIVLRLPPVFRFVLFRFLPAMV